LLLCAKIVHRQRKLDRLFYVLSFSVAINYQAPDQLKLRGEKRNREANQYMLERLSPLFSEYEKIREDFESIKEQIPAVEREIVQFRFCHLGCALMGFDLSRSVDTACAFEFFAEMATKLRSMLRLHTESTDGFKLWKGTNRYSLDYPVRTVISMKGLKNVTDDQRKVMEEMEKSVTEANQHWDFRMSDQFRARWFGLAG
jgi:hypothetical protein